MDPVDVLVYTINLSEYPFMPPIYTPYVALTRESYDQALPQDKSTNKFLHSLDLLADLLNAKCFKSCSHFFVYLNCVDLFKNKAAMVDLKGCFPEYDGIAIL